MNFNLKRKLQNYMRILKIAKKPSMGEFLKSAKICLVGLIIVGLIGFLVYLVSISVPFI